jgi:hypothetical protein
LNPDQDEPFAKSTSEYLVISTTGRNLRWQGTRFLAIARNDKKQGILHFAHYNPGSSQVVFLIAKGSDFRQLENGASERVCRDAWQSAKGLFE